MFDLQTTAAAYISGDAIEPTAAELSELRLYVKREFSLVPVPVILQPQDISLADCIDRFYKEAKLYISIENNFHPYLTGWENAHFRAIHDWHHIVSGGDDTFAGECKAYQHAIQSADNSIHWLLHSEIVGQAAAAIVTGEFQAQKFVNILGA
jgi:hypothetical protein